MTEIDLLPSFQNDLNVVVIGASGGLGRAFIEHLSRQSNVKSIHAFSRSNASFSDPKISTHEIDLVSEKTIEKAAAIATQKNLIDILIVATGVLHDQETMPEKNIQNLNIENFQNIFAINSFGPALVAKHFIPHIRRDQKSVFAFLSARVGSISDNQLGGWYSYRASKAALNMMIKNFAIEVARRCKKACIIGLHPGTVNTDLSRPFQGQVPPDKLFTPAYSAEQLLKVINDVQPNQSGRIFAWDGQEIPA